MSPTRRLVVTGASTGIGRAIASLARERGWEVLGTVRKDADAQALAALGIATARLDLSDPASIADGCAEILGWSGGRVDAVVHNAGSTWPGPLELMKLEDLRQQFEVNVFGHIDITQRLLPAVRAAGGRMVFISSDSVTVTPPFMGAYAASKRAIEALAEALAQETMGQGIDILVVAPGPYATAIWETSTPRGTPYLDGKDSRSDLYKRLGNALAKAATGQPMHDPRDLAEVVLHALTTAHPAFRYTAPFSRRVMGVVRWFAPTRWFHRLFVSELLRRGER